MDKLINYDHLEYAITRLKSYIDLSSGNVDFDDLDIGCTNLLHNTDFRIGEYYWDKESMSVTIIDCESEEIGFSHIAKRCARLTNLENTSLLSQVAMLNSGEQYTASCWIRSKTGHCCISVFYYDENDAVNFLSQEIIDATNEWIHITHTFTANASNRKHIIAFGIIDKESQAEDKACYIYEPKLEKGIVATDWTISPEDIEIYVQNYIETTREELLYYADNTFTTKEEHQNFSSQVDARFTQVNDTLETRFALVSSNTNDVNSYLNQFKEQVESNIVFNENGTSIKKESLELSINEDKISFIEKNNEIVNIQNGKMNASDASVSNTLLINNFKFVPGASGNLSLVWDDQGGDN